MTCGVSMFVNSGERISRKCNHLMCNEADQLSIKRRNRRLLYKKYIFHKVMDDLVKKSKELSIQERDEDYYGLQGLDPNTVLYRACRSGENTDADILCKGKTQKDFDRIVEQHINSGSRNPSRFISTTALSNVALEWAFYTKETPDSVQERLVPQPVIIIYLSKMTFPAVMPEVSGIINLTNEEVRKHFVKGATQINRVKSSQEVLFQWRIPKKKCGENVFELWENPQKPPKPKSKVPKRRLTDHKE